MTVGERIKEYRKQAGLTQKELGDRLGVSNVHIGQYERGLRNPRLPQLKKIADALDIPFDLLVSDKVEALVDTSRQIDPSIMDAFTQGEFEEKLSHIGYSLRVINDNTFSCFTRSGEQFRITQEDINQINEQVNSYLRFLISDYMSKRNQ